MFTEHKNILSENEHSFTLLELIVVIIIIGILGTLGYTQYTNTLENARGAEARANLALVRKNYIGFYLSNGSTSGLTAEALGIGSPPGQLPSSCNTNYYFSYSFYTGTGMVGGDPAIAMLAFRCTSGGKTPQASCQYKIYTFYNPITGADQMQCYNCDGSVTSGAVNGPWVRCP